MEFRNYCITIMGDTENVLGEILKIAETEPNIMDANGILVSTFTSALSPRELTDYFKENKRNFLIFDMNQDNSGYYFIKKDINDGLFGFLKNMDENGLKEKMDGLIQEISSSTVTNKAQKITTKKPQIQTKITAMDVSKMSLKDKNDLMNQILTKDGKNISDSDREILDILSS